MSEERETTYHCRQSGRAGPYLPGGRLDVDGSPPAGEGALHAEEEAALGVGLLGLGLDA